MRFSVTTLLALASAVAAQTSGFDAITTPAKDQQVPAGSTFEIDWQPGTATGTVSIILLGGSSPNTLEILSTIASNVSNADGKYEWAVASTLGSLATYGLKIQLDADATTFQYSFPFEITGGSSSSSASGSASGSGSGTATATATVTTATGSTTAAPTTSTSVTTIVLTSTSKPGNLSTTAAPTKTLTTVIGGSSSSSTASAVATGAGANVRVGSMAFLGGLALAAFAL